MSNNDYHSDNEEITADEDNLSEINGDSNGKLETKVKSGPCKNWTDIETHVLIHGLRKYECYIPFRSQLIEKVHKHMQEYEV